MTTEQQRNILPIERESPDRLDLQDRMCVAVRNVEAVLELVAMYLLQNPNSPGSDLDRNIANLMLTTQVALGDSYDAFSTGAEECPKQTR